MAVDAPEVEATAIPAPPRDLPKDVAGIWRRLAEEVEPLGVVGPGDLTGFRLLVLAVARAERLAADPNASTIDQCRSASAAVQLLANFGLTPASRERAAKAKRPASDDDPLAEFLTDPLAD